jgi:glycine betaine catabolism B
MKCIVIKKKNLSKNAIEITFRPQLGFKFVAGQSIEIIIPEIKDDPISNRRSFSIASSPHHQDISVIVRTHEHVYPFKRHLIDSLIGSEIEVSEPSGTFVLPKNEKQDIVFIAGGIGITPFLSMIFFAYKKKLLYNIHLLYFSKSAKEEVYRKELQVLTAKSKFLKISEFYGPLEHDILKTALLHDSNAVYYIAGPPGMVTQAVLSIKKLGVPDVQIKVEEFKGYN